MKSSLQEKLEPVNKTHAPSSDDSQTAVPTTHTTATPTRKSTTTDHSTIIIDDASPRIQPPSYSNYQDHTPANPPQVHTQGTSRRVIPNEEQQVHHLAESSSTPANTQIPSQLTQILTQLNTICQNLQRNSPPQAYIQQGQNIIPQTSDWQVRSMMLEMENIKLQNSLILERQQLMAEQLKFPVNSRRYAHQNSWNGESYYNKNRMNDDQWRNRRNFNQNPNQPNWRNKQVETVSTRTTENCTITLPVRRPTDQPGTPLIREIRSVRSSKNTVEKEAPVNTSQPSTSSTTLTTNPNNDTPRISLRPNNRKTLTNLACDNVNINDGDNCFLANNTTPSTRI